MHDDPSCRCPCCEVIGPVGPKPDLSRLEAWADMSEEEVAAEMEALGIDLEEIRESGRRFVRSLQEVVQTTGVK